MRRFLILASTIFFMSASAVQAAELCEPDGQGSEPLSSHTESRFTRYLRSSSQPKALRNDAEKIRWEWLADKSKCEKQNRKDRHAGNRTDSASTRFRIRTETNIVEEDEVAPVFDPEGLGSEPLAKPHREIRVQRYASRNNCRPSVLGNEEEMTRCKYLVLKQENFTNRTTSRRRLSSSATRAASPTVTGLSRRKNTDGYTDGVGYSSGVSEGELRKVDFDQDGPGSTPLSGGVEVRLRRYVDGGKCPVTNDSSVTERCLWLLDQKNYYRMDQQSKTRKRLQSRGLGNAILRRSVGIQSQSVLRARQIGGGRPSVRTVKAVEERFGIERGTGRRWRQNVIPGD